jgi:hypothetical protein
METMEIINNWGAVAVLVLILALRCSFLTS